MIWMGFHGFRKGFLRIVSSTVTKIWFLNRSGRSHLVQGALYLQNKSLGRIKMRKVCLFWLCLQQTSLKTEQDTSNAQDLELNPLSEVLPQNKTGNKLMFGLLWVAEVFKQNSHPDRRRIRRIPAFRKKQVFVYNMKHFQELMVSTSTKRFCYFIY